MIYCHARKEDSVHYLLVCPAYAANRMEMITLVTDVIPHGQMRSLNLKTAEDKKGFVIFYFLALEPQIKTFKFLTL